MKGCGRVEVKLHLFLTVNTRWRRVATFLPCRSLSSWVRPAVHIGRKIWWTSGLVWKHRNKQRQFFPLREIKTPYHLGPSRSLVTTLTEQPSSLVFRLSFSIYEYWRKRCISQNSLVLSENILYISMVKISSFFVFIRVNIRICLLSVILHLRITARYNGFVAQSITNGNTVSGNGYLVSHFISQVFSCMFLLSWKSYSIIGQPAVDSLPFRCSATQNPRDWIWIKIYF
jgi:hypothetical protein